MKKIFCLMLALLLCLTALGEVLLEKSEYARAGELAAQETGAVCAYYSAADESVYYVKDGCIVKQSEDGSAAVSLAELPFGNSYPAIGAGADGSVYVLRCDEEADAKSGVIRISEGGYALNYEFAGASGVLAPAAMEFSALTDMGFVLFDLKSEGGDVGMFSPLCVFWDTLSGYDEFVVLERSGAQALILPAADFFDAYGSVNEAGSALIGRIQSGELVSAADASLSPDGTALLVKGTDGSFYVMDAFSYVITKLQLPEGFKGSVQWSGQLVTAGGEGEEGMILYTIPEEDNFDDAEWGEDVFGTGFESDWNDVGSEELTDWS